jgi:hypothetical protein
LQKVNDFSTSTVLEQSRKRVLRQICDKIKKNVQLKVRLNGLTFSFDYVGYIYEHFWQNRLVMIELHMNIIKLLLDVIMVTVYEEA